jgi:hypothetical protein
MIFPQVPMGSAVVFSLHGIDSTSLAQSTDFLGLINSKPRMVVFCGKKTAEYWHDCFDEELVRHVISTSQQDQIEILTIWENKYIKAYPEAVKLVQCYYPGEEPQVCFITCDDLRSIGQQ